MTFQTKKIDWLLCVIILLGCVLRFRPGVLAGFPINDGGMLLAMIRDLRSNQFLLPFVTSYNYSNIPFVYPPFAMYVGGILSSLLSISDLDLLRWLPPLVTTATLPAFYWLSRQILDSKSKALIAITLYALMPGTSDWFVMGGGLTRSMGTLFSLLAIGVVYQMFRGLANKTMIGLAILFCSLTVLSHPEVGLQTAMVCFMFFVLYGRDRSGIKNAVFVASGTALLTAPWWLTILIYHGLSPFWSAVHTGIHETLLASLFHSFFSTQGGLPILTVCELVGVFVVLRKKEPLLLLWAILPFFVDPRNGSAIAMFPLIMLASEGLYYLGKEFSRAFTNTFPENRTASYYASALTQGSFVIILFYLYFTAFAATSNLVRISVSKPDRETMRWIKENTPSESSFLLITNAGQVSPMADSFQEWFPVLAERRSGNTLQGLEWTLGSDFFDYSQRLVALQTCAEVDCLNQWLRQNHVQVDFIVLQKKRASPKLVDSLHADERYDPVYNSANTEIFAINP